MRNTVSKAVDLLNALTRFVKVDVWQKDFSKVSQAKRLLYEEIKLAYLVVKSFFRDRMFIRASALVYATLLGVAPLIAVVFSLFKGFGFHLKLAPALEKWATPFGEKAVLMVRQMITELDHTDLSAFGLAGLAFLFVSLASIIDNIERAFNDIWHIDKRRSFMRRVGDYTGLIIFIPVLLIGMPAFNAAIQTVPILSLIRHFPALLWLLNKATPFFVVWVIFTFLYAVLPNTIVRTKSAMLGALYAAFLWQLSNFYFTKFLVTTYQTGVRAALYAGFAGFMLFLSWLYIGWVVILLGAEIAYVDQNKARVRSEVDKVKFNFAFRERLALQLLLFIAERFYLGEEAPLRSDISCRFPLPERLLDKTLSLLLRLRLIYEMPINDSDRRYTLARCPQHITVRDVLQGLRGFGAAIDTSDGTLYHTAASTIQGNLDRLIDETFSSQSIQDILEKEHSVKEA